MIRKHRFAILAIAAFNFIVFFPLLFMGRVVSPNDVFYNYDPWAESASHAPVQNSLLNDPPTSHLTQAVLLKSGGSFDWNPYLASGIPGLGASPGLFAPFGLIPLFAMPIGLFYTGIIFLKLNVAFWLAYAWLREEKLGRRGAAIGALIAAGAGVYSVRWLWQVTNATVLYPAMLLFVRRMFNGKRNSIALMALVAFAYALTGFPSSMAYGAYLAIAYAIYLAIRQRRFPGLRIAEGAAAATIALVMAAPSLVSFAQFIRRTGYLTMRGDMSVRFTFPLSHLRSFLDPDRLGNPAYKNWIGDPTFGPMNNYVEATIYLGLAAIPLVLFGLFNRRARERWFWLAVGLIVFAAMFGLAGMPLLLGSLPGFKYSPLARTSVMLPIPVAYLAASGATWIALQLRRWTTRGVTAVAIALLTLFVAGDLAILAGRFYPYLPVREAAVRSTPTIAFLQEQKPPFRVAPFFNYLWPNAAEMFRIEDVRSHFSSEAKYRRMLNRVDPTSWSGRSTVLLFNGLEFNFSDPFLGMLGVRYFVEQKGIDIIKWTTLGATEPGVRQSGAFILKPGVTMSRTVAVDDRPFYAIDLPVSIEKEVSRAPRLVVELLKYGSQVFSREFSPQEIADPQRVYIPLRPFARSGDTITLRVTAAGLSARMLQSVPVKGEDPLFYGRVKSPVVFDRELPDGRLFLNLAEVPRFHAVRSVVKMTDDQLLARTDIDFGDTAVITAPGVTTLPATTAEASVYLVRYTAGEQRLSTDSLAPFFLASSEKLTPELRVTIDGREVGPVEINSLFAGVSVPAGQHRVVFTRRVGRGYWWPAAVALALFVVIALLETAGAARAYRRARRGSASATTMI